jgi:hypothetical protein
LVVMMDKKEKRKQKGKKKERNRGKKRTIFKILSGLVFYSIQRNRKVIVNKIAVLTYLHDSLVETRQNNVKENCVTSFLKENLSASLWFNIVTFL